MLAASHLVAATRLLWAVLERSEAATKRGGPRRRAPAAAGGGSASRRELQEVLEAAERCRDAYTARYGIISEDAYITLLRVNMRMKWSEPEVEACTQQLTFMSV